MRRNRCQFLGWIVTLIAVATVFSAAPANADTPWPLLRFGRLLPVETTTQTLLRFGGSGAAASVRGRPGFAARGGVGLNMPVGNHVDLGLAIFAVQGVRAQRTTDAYGHTRVDAAGRWGAWRTAIGADLWIGDAGIPSLFQAIGPWGAISRDFRRGFLSAQISWDRSDQVGLFAPVAAWAESTRPGLSSGLTGGWRGPWFDAMLSYRLTGRAARLQRDLIAMDIERNWDTGVGSVRTWTYLQRGLIWMNPDDPLSFGLGVELRFWPKTLWQELFPSQDRSSATEFDPFGQ